MQHVRLGRTGLSASVFGARGCRDEPGAHVILSGTGSLEHLRENLRSLAHPGLPAHQRDRLRQLFHGVFEVSGQ